MLRWTLAFLLLSVIAAYLGFFALAGLAAILSKVFLAIFLILLVVSVVSGAMSIRRRV